MPRVNAAYALYLLMLEHGGERTPTEWAKVCFPGSRRHSAYTSPLLLRLVREGRVVRRTTAEGRVTYEPLILTDVWRR